MSKQIILLSVVAFVLNVIWENAQAPLFQGYISFWQHFPICLWGTFGDVAIVLLVYLLISLLKSDYLWVTKLSAKDIAVLVIIGFFAAVAIEYRALLFDRWAYTSAMPIIPYIKVGLTPIVQMIVLLPLTMYVVKKLTAKL